jgi:hypothetical protein
VIGSIITYIIAPENTPAIPIPAIARPTMKVVELGAVPHRRDPTSKTVKADKKVHLAGKIL